MTNDFGAGFHVAPGQNVDVLAYEQWTGPWSLLAKPRAFRISRSFRAACKGIDQVPPCPLSPNKRALLWTLIDVRSVPQAEVLQLAIGLQ